MLVELLATIFGAFKNPSERTNSERTNSERSKNSFYRSKYEYFKEAHEFEIERRERLNSRLSLLTTSLAAGAGFVAYYVHGPFPEQAGFTDIAFTVSCIFGVYCLLMGALQSWKVIGAREYKYPASVEKIRKFLEDLEVYNSQIDTVSRQDPELVLWSELADTYCDCAKVNFEQNVIRARLYRAAILWSLLAIVFFTIALPFFTVINRLQHSPTLVKVVEPIQINERQIPGK